MAQSGSRAPARARPAKDRTTLYEEITSKIIAELEAGRLPWVQPCGSSGVRAPLGLPKNGATGRAYSGINVLILWSAVVENGFTVQNWLTFKQAVALGGNVRKGERGTTVVYADRFIPDDVRDRAHRNGEEPRAIPFLKRFTVFNAEQCEGLPDGIAAVVPPVETSLILPQAEELIRAIGADIRNGGDKAYYDVAGDFIRVPPPQAFFEPINWHRTVWHEHIHYAEVGIMPRSLGRRAKRIELRVSVSRSRYRNSVGLNAGCGARGYGDFRRGREGRSSASGSGRGAGGHGEHGRWSRKGRVCAVSHRSPASVRSCGC
jgi:antirestriction protein ArdC